MGWIGAAAIALALLGCGAPEHEESGRVQNESATAGVIALNDASAPQSSRSAIVRADGSFSFHLDGLRAPYLLRADWVDRGVETRFYAVAEGRENLDVNALTDVAFRCRHDDSDRDERGDDREDSADFDHSDRDGKLRFAADARRILAELSAVLAPLFERYGLVDPRTDRAAVRLLLDDVMVVRSGRKVTVTNRETGGVIFVGRISRLPDGVFTRSNLPGPCSGGSPGTGQVCVRPPPTHVAAIRAAPSSPRSP